jgi:mono/diheme cytochrome c family protein
MKSPLLAGVLIGTALTMSAASAQVLRADFGRNEYRVNCMVCHGEKGKGDGSYGELLKTRLPDLTTIAKRNAGVFPFSNVVKTIDGREMPKAHGSSEMPIWGQAYNVKAAEYFQGQAYDPEAFVQARVLALVEYIYTLQTR